MFKVKHRRLGTVCNVYQVVRQEMYHTPLFLIYWKGVWQYMEASLFEPDISETNNVIEKI